MLSANAPQVNQVPYDPNAAVPYDPNALAAAQQVPQDPNAGVMQQQPVQYNPNGAGMPQQQVAYDPNAAAAQYPPAPYPQYAPAPAGQYPVTEGVPPNTAAMSDRDDIPKSKTKLLPKAVQKSGDDSDVHEDSEI